MDLKIKIETKLESYKLRREDDLKKFFEENIKKSTKNGMIKLN